MTKVGRHGKTEKLGRVEKLLILREYSGEDCVITSFDMQELLKTQPAGITFKSKLPSLDRIIDHFEGGELIAISGPRKGGKTLLGQTLTVSFFEQGIKSLWFSYELTPRQFLRCFPELPYFLMPKRLKAHALGWIEDRVVEAVAKHSVGAVFIDHLHFLFDIARSRNPSLEIGQVIRFLKSLAVELNLTIFVLCHMQKLDSKEEPSDEHFRDSSFVAQETDAGFVIWRVRNTENQAMLKVCYHRSTGTWERKIKLIKVNGLLREAEKHEI